MTMLYFAYASNMDPVQGAYRNVGFPPCRDASQG